MKVPRASGNGFFVGLSFLRPTVVAAAVLAAACSICTADAPASADDLFRSNVVWNLHFRFTADQWAALEPVGGAGLDRPRDSSTNTSTRPNFGPSLFLAPLFWERAGGGFGGGISGEQFHTMAASLVREWDPEGSGVLDERKIADGLDRCLAGRAEPLPDASPLRGPDGRRNGAAAAAGVQFNFARAEMEWNGTRIGNVAVRCKGNTTFLQSRGGLKRPMKVRFDRLQAGGAFAGQTCVNLHNNITDPTGLREAEAFDLFRRVGVPAPRTSFARVSLSVEGRFEQRLLGLYTIVENIDSGFIARHFQQPGGALFKPVTRRLFEDLGDNWESYRRIYAPKTKPGEEQKRRLIELCRFVSKATDAEFSAKLGEFFDSDSLARYLAVTVWLADVDGLLGPGQNYFLALEPKGGRFQFLPWDQHQSFGWLAGGAEDPAGLSIRHPWTGKNRFLERLFSVRTFRERYSRELEVIARSTCTPEHMATDIAAAESRIGPVAAEESSMRLSASADPRRRDDDGNPLRFAAKRNASVLAQLKDESDVEAPSSPLDDPSGREPIKAGVFLARPLLRALGVSAEGAASSNAVVEGFDRLFHALRKSGTGVVGYDDLSAWIDRAAETPAPQDSTSPR
jgi:spore coat protein H